MSQQKNQSAYQTSFLKKLKQYIYDLQQLQTRLTSNVHKYRQTLSLSALHKNSTTSNPTNPTHALNANLLNQTTLLHTKLELEIQKYKQIINKVQNKVVTKGGIQNIRRYVEDGYGSLVRQVGRIIGVLAKSGGRSGGRSRNIQQYGENQKGKENQAKLQKDNQFKRIALFQSQMDSEWQSISKGKTHNKSQQKTYLQPYPTQTNPSQTLSQLASSQIHHEFLAIRLLSYKMYQTYNVHTHEKTYQQIQTLKQQQSKLQKQIRELKEIRMGLLAEEKKIWTELGEVRKVNQLVGRRYFIGGVDYCEDEG